MDDPISEHQKIQLKRLIDAQQSFEASNHTREFEREKRNAEIRRAVNSYEMTLAQVASATGLKRARIEQIVTGRKKQK